MRHDSLSQADRVASAASVSIARMATPRDVMALAFYMAQQPLMERKQNTYVLELAANITWTRFDTYCPQVRVPMADSTLFPAPTDVPDRFDCIMADCT